MQTTKRFRCHVAKYGKNRYHVQMALSASEPYNTLELCETSEIAIAKVQLLRIGANQHNSAQAITKRIIGRWLQRNGFKVQAGMATRRYCEYAYYAGHKRITFVISECGAIDAWLYTGFYSVARQTHTIGGLVNMFKLI